MALDVCVRAHTKKRILMVGPLPPTVGGITTFITSVLESDLGEKYELITFGTERPIVGLVKDVDDYTLMFRIKLKLLVKSIMSTISHLFMFPIALIMNRPNLVHIHTSVYWSYWENVVYLLISNLFLKKTVLHLHTGLFDKFYERSNFFAKFLIRKSLGLSDEIIVLSRKWKIFLKNLIPENKIAVLENFVNFSRYVQFKREVDFQEGTINILFVGGVGAKMKGVYDVFKAIPMAVRQCKNICFVFVACASIEKHDIISKGEEIISHTKFLDYIYGDKKTKVFINSDIFILPSYSEGLPITMLEAMAAGLPIIATAVGSVPEAIEDGKNGFLIKTGDYKALAEKILILAKDKKLRRKMALNNINKIRNRYDLTVVMEKLDNLYAQLLVS